MAGKAMTKTQVLSTLAESTGLSKGQIEDVLGAIGTLIGSELNAGNPFNRARFDEGDNSGQGRCSGRSAYEPVYRRDQNGRSQAGSDHRQGSASQGAERPGCATFG